MHIVIKVRDETINKINEELTTIWRKKLIINKERSKKIKGLPDKKYCLNESLDDF